MHVQMHSHSPNDIADASDWLHTPLAALAALENALHCQICKEFYDTPMLTSCSHTFCSKCIRTSLSADGRCPACRTPDQASKLRNNWQLQEVVAAFEAARPHALGIARQEREQAGNPRRSIKRKWTVPHPEDAAEAETGGRTTRRKSRRLAASQSSQLDTLEISDSDEDVELDQPQDDGLVECPLGCAKRMKIDAVEPHLDRCEDEKTADKRVKSRTPVGGFGKLKTSTRGTPTPTPMPQDRISELNYSLLKENAMRKKFEELGIPSFGSKQLMVRRHTEWVNLWNANCDSSHPRTKRELLQDLDIWERTQGGRAPQVNLGPTIMRKDFDGAAWASKNKEDFSRLIADARRKKGNPSTTATPDPPAEQTESKINDAPSIKAKPVRDVTSPDTWTKDSVPRDQPADTGYQTSCVPVSPSTQKQGGNAVQLQGNLIPLDSSSNSTLAEQSSLPHQNIANSTKPAIPPPESAEPLSGIEEHVPLSQIQPGLERANVSPITDQ